MRVEDLEIVSTVVVEDGGTVKGMDVSEGLVYLADEADACLVLVSMSTGGRMGSWCGGKKKKDYPCLYRNLIVLCRFGRWCA